MASPCVDLSWKAFSHSQEMAGSTRHAGKELLILCRNTCGHTLRRARKTTAWKITYRLELLSSVPRLITWFSFSQGEFLPGWWLGQNREELVTKTPVGYVWEAWEVSLSLHHSALSLEFMETVLKQCFRINLSLSCPERGHVAVSYFCCM